MSYLDKTFCASPQCKNECGRQMTSEERAKKGGIEWVSYAYFCGEPQFAISRVSNPDSFDLPNDVVITNLE